MASQTVGNNWASSFRLFNAVVGGLVMAGGTLTAFYTLIKGGAPTAQLFAAGIGAAQVVVADILCQINNPNPPAAMVAYSTTTAGTPTTTTTTPGASA